MTNTQIKQWLLAVGAQFGITEVHHIWRSDDKLRKPKDYFTFEVKTSEPTDDHRLEDTSNTYPSHDIAYTLTKRWRTTVSVKCFSENGRYILQCLEASRYLPTIKDIFGDSIKIFGCGQITSESWTDESTKEYQFATDFTFIEWVQFTITEVRSTVDTLTLDGDLNDSNGVPVEITASATRPIPT